MKIQVKHSRCFQENCEFRSAHDSFIKSEETNQNDNVNNDFGDTNFDWLVDDNTLNFQSTDCFGTETEEGIEEVYVNEDQTSLPIFNIESRKRYQRFRLKRFICDHCDRSFTLRQNIQFHIVNYHIKNQNVAMRKGKRFVCRSCNKIFKSEESANRHHERKHVRIPAITVHKCSVCTRIFNSASQLREHISIQHLLERPHKCKQCGAKFGRSGGLRRHFIMVHTDRKFHCKYDGCTHPGFKCSKALTAHIRSKHTKDRPFACEDCGRRFVRKNDLRVHLLIHTEDEQYYCKRCGQKFRRNIYLKKHENSCKVRLGSIENTTESNQKI